MPKYEISVERMLGVSIVIEAESIEAAKEKFTAGYWTTEDEVSTESFGDNVVGVEPVEDGTASNPDRAHAAQIVLAAFVAHTRCTREDALGDLLRSLMHWSVPNKFDFDLALDRARHQFKLSTVGGPTQSCA